MLNRCASCSITEQTLVALALTETITPDHFVYQNGLNYLLSTEFDDGSWFVKTRAWPMQPLFDSQFPHGKDQWISASATTWATMAMLLAVDSASPLTNHFANRDIASFEKNTSFNETPTLGKKVDFTSDIQPLLKRSCMKCHSGYRPKAKLDLSNRKSILMGGESGIPAIQPGNPEESPLYQFSIDSVEDMEMPPLSIREKYPALRKEEQVIIRAWIEQGAHWKN